MPFPRSGFISVDTHVGNTIKIPIANMIEITMVRSIITFSALSPNKGVRMKSSGIGGQAVMEGIMMRNGSEYSVAVRKENGEIEVKKET